MAADSDEDDIGPIVLTENEEEKEKKRIEEMRKRREAMALRALTSESDRMVEINLTLR